MNRMLRNLLAAAIDFGLFALLSRSGLSIGSAHVLSFMVACVVLFLFAGGAERPAISRLGQWGFFVLLGCVMWLRGALLGVLTVQWRLPPEGAFLFALALTLYGVVHCQRLVSGAYSWAQASVLMTAYFVLLRLLFLGLPDLIPEEAYYWLYGRNLALGYLDHPPLTGWLIRLSTELWGTSEFAVRFPAIICWAIGARYLYLLATDIFDSENGVVSVALYSSLPFFTGIGYTVAPDSALVAAWMAGLYYAHGALLKERRSYWLGLGVSIGVGLLAKYTMVLLGGSVVLLMLLYSPGRKWFFRIEPYGAAILSLLIFSPVLYWNYTHAWASFVFQGPRRFEMPSEFAVHKYILDVLVLITPSGLLGLLLCMTGLPREDRSSGLPDMRAQRLFVWCAILVPFVVFLAYSFQHETKLNWSGPAYLALLPCLARQVLLAADVDRGKFHKIVAASWAPVLAVCTLLLGGVLHYAGLGLPFVPYTNGTRRFVGWDSLASQVEPAVRELRQGGAQSVGVLGLDKHNIASELKFYLSKKGVEVPVLGRSLVGREDLMFRFWNLQEKIGPGADMVLVARSEGDITDTILQPYFESLSEVQMITTGRSGRTVGAYLMRIGRNFHPAGAPAEAPEIGGE